MANETNNNVPLGYGSPFNLSYTYGYINNNMFYPLIPKEYYQYYQRFVKQYFYWYDGYVPYFHNPSNGIFSTRLANTICKRLAELTNGGRLSFDYNEETDDEETLPSVNKWASKNDFSNLISQAFEFAYAGGDSLGILNYDGKDLWTEVLRKDYYYFETDFRGNIIDMTYFIYSYTKSNKEFGETKDEDTYYLLQNRYFDENDKPKYKIFVKMLKGNMVNNKEVDPTHETIEWNQLPKTVKKAIKNNYGDVNVGVEYDLPFKDHLGVYLFKATKHLSFLPASPYGESVINNILSYLWLWDYYTSNFATDQYLGRGRVLVPMSMQQNVGFENDNINSYQQNYNSALPSQMYTKMEFVDPEHAKPTPIQFDTRANEWIVTAEHLIQLIANALNVSSRDIADWVNNSTNVTAKEVSVEQSKTTLWVENKRELNTPVINRILEDVKDFYGWKSDIVVKFSKAGLTNYDNLVTQITRLKDANLIDDKTAIATLFPDKTTSQQIEILNNIPNNITSTKNEEMSEKSVDDTTQEMNNNDINHIKTNK